jgi:hypothetical protein
LKSRDAHQKRKVKIVCEDFAEVRFLSADEHFDEEVKIMTIVNERGN